MTADVAPLDLPDDGGDEAACASVSRGLVMHVDQCLEHEHWIHLHSLNRWEIEADGLHHVIAHGGVLVESDIGINEHAATDIAFTAGQDIAAHAGDKIVLHAGSLVACDAPHVTVGFETPHDDERDGQLQLQESAASGIYLGNTDNPRRRVLDWYEEGEWALAWSAGGAVAPVAHSVARFTRIGDIVVIHVLIDYVLPPDGAADWSFSLPVAPAAGISPCGAAVLERGGARLEATATIDAATVRLLRGDAFVATAHPGLADGDRIAFSLAYVAA